MQIIAQRGYWNKTISANTPMALKCALEMAMVLNPMFETILAVWSYLIISQMGL